MNALHHSPLATSSKRNDHGDDHETPVIRQALGALADGGRARARRHANRTGDGPARCRTAAHRRSQAGPRARQPASRGRRGRAFLQEGRRAVELRLCPLPAPLRRPGRSGEVPRPGVHRQSAGCADGFPRHAAGRPRDRRRPGFRRRHGRRRRAASGGCGLDDHKPQRHGEDRGFPPVDKRSRRFGRARPPLRRHSHHRQDRPCGFPRTDGRRQPGLCHHHPAGGGAVIEVPSHDPACRTMAIFPAASRRKS